jgi:hypothetical protein
LFGLGWTTGGVCAFSAERKQKATCFSASDAKTFLFAHSPDSRRFNIRAPSYGLPPTAGAGVGIDRLNAC